jgi:hypothetical protein
MADGSSPPGRYRGWKNSFPAQGSSRRDQLKVAAGTAVRTSSCIPEFLKQNAGCRSCESSSGIAVDVQQRLNCALSSFSLSPGFFRFQGLNGIARGFLHAL